MDDGRSPPACLDGATLVDSFVDGDGVLWAACEDLQRPDGDIVLVSSSSLSAQGAQEAASQVVIERFAKSYAPFTTNYTDDARYYLGLGKRAVADATTDVMGAALLAGAGGGVSGGGGGEGMSWSAVERAVPAIRRSGKRADGKWSTNCVGARTFVGSRSAASDTTFDDQGGDCSWAGWPHASSYVINMHNKAVGAPQQTINGSVSADGSVGLADALPTAIFYLPMLDNGTSSANRYWTYFAAAVPDVCPDPAAGCREQVLTY